MLKSPKLFTENTISKLDSSTPSITFEIILTHRYPYRHPQVICLTPFSPIALCDGRDLFHEIVGKDGWKKDLHISEILLFLPEFVEWLFGCPISILKEVVGTFHLGQTYNLRELQRVRNRKNEVSQTITPACEIFLVDEQSEADGNKFYPRYLVLSETMLLLFDA